MQIQIKVKFLLPAIEKRINHLDLVLNIEAITTLRTLVDNINSCIDHHNKSWLARLQNFLGLRKFVKYIDMHFLVEHSKINLNSGIDVTNVFVELNINNIYKVEYLNLGIIKLPCVSYSVEYKQSFYSCLVTLYNKLCYFKRTLKKLDPYLKIELSEQDIQDIYRL